MNNNIFIRRQNKVVLPLNNTRDSTLSFSHLATINRNLESLGYTLSNSVLEKLQSCSLEQTIKFYNDLVDTLKELRGVRDYRPMYPNFPRQVMEASDAELYINAFMHYFSVWVADVTGNETFVWLPQYKKEFREPLDETVKLTVIKLGTEEEYHRMFANLFSANTSISATDKEDLKQYLASNPQIVLPQTIPHKENLAFIAAQLLTVRDMSGYFKTATDVLRLAVAMSNGDVSLAQSCKFRSFTRAERRSLLKLLENVGNATEDMLRWKKRWIKLGERLHPGEYKQLINVNKSFEVLRNNLSFLTFNAKVENEIKNKEILEAANTLKARPGMFARRLDQLLRLAPSHDTIIDFAEVADKVSTPVLLQAMAHFKNRNITTDLRVFFPKGNVCKSQAVPYNLPAIDEKLCKKVVKVCEKTLVDRFSKLSPLGNCVLDENLKTYLVPFSQRSASKALHTLVRGSHIPLNDDNKNRGHTVRFFIYWREPRNMRTDIDLSAVTYDENWKYKEHLSWTCLRSANGWHSGDITSAPNGACEFIDLNIPSYVKDGARYVIMNVYNYTLQPYKDLPECFAGWMIRQKPQSGEIFEPKTVQNRVDLANDGTAAIPLIIDLVERKVIWVDVGFKGRVSFGGRGNTIESNYDRVTLLGKSFMNITKPNLYDLFSLHVKARGRLVKSQDKAKTIFSVDNGITPFDIERIMAEFLTS